MSEIFVVFRFRAHVDPYDIEGDYYYDIKPMMFYNSEEKAKKCIMENINKEGVTINDIEQGIEYIKTLDDYGSWGYYYEKWSVE